MAPPTNQTIAERVRSAMEKAGVSEVVLADDTGIPRTTLRRRLTGMSDWLTGELTAISGRLDVALVELLADEVAA
jgi:hypothetical protein